MCGVPKGAFDAHCAKKAPAAGAAGDVNASVSATTAQKKPPRDFNAEDVMEGLRAVPKTKVAEHEQSGALDSVKTAVRDVINSIKRALPSSPGSRQSVN